MNTLHAPASASACLGSVLDLAADGPNVARTRTTEPPRAPWHEDRPLWTQLLRFGLHGAALGMVTGLGIVLFNRIAQLL